MFDFNQPKLKLGVAFTRRDTWMNKETESNKNDIIKKVSILVKSQDIEAFSTERGYEISNYWEFDFPIKSTQKFHTRRIYRFKVGCWRLKKEGKVYK